MTAEVGVLNRLGVALAADSAVSIGVDADKIYTSADKLFQLCQSAPIGIMINGNADFVGLPWETIIKKYRQTLGEERFDTVSHYADHFFKFLQRNRVMFPQAQQDDLMSGLIYSLLIHVRDKAEDALSQQAEVQDGLDEDDIAPIVAGVVRNMLKWVQSFDYLPGITPSRRARIVSRFAKRVAEAKKSVFGDLPLSSGTSRQITSIAREMPNRRCFGPQESGIVFAGFGETEYTPSLFAYAVEGMVDGIPRAFLLQSVQIDYRNSASIIPFAQQEMVHAFLQGIDDKLKRDMKSSTSTLFRGALDTILGVVEKSDSTMAGRLRDAIQPETDTLLNSLFTDWDKRSKQYWMPIVDIVSSLPKDELASMAESLVNLTKFKRRVTPERETVGGPIDVAVITKGDGFVWVKRKHYFEPSLNPRVISKYSREG